MVFRQSSLIYTLCTTSLSKIRSPLNIVILKGIHVIYTNLLLSNDNKSQQILCYLIINYYLQCHVFFVQSTTRQFATHAVNVQSAGLSPIQSNRVIKAHQSLECPHRIEAVHDIIRYIQYEVTRGGCDQV